MPFLNRPDPPMLVRVMALVILKIILVQHVNSITSYYPMCTKRIQYFIKFTSKYMISIKQLIKEAIPVEYKLS